MNFRLTVCSSYVTENCSEFSAKNLRGAKRQVSKIIPMSGRWYFVNGTDVATREISWGYRGEHGWEAKLVPQKA